MPLHISQQIQHPDQIEEFLNKIIEALKTEGIRWDILFTNPQEYTADKNEAELFPINKSYVINLAGKLPGEILANDRRSLTPKDVLRTLLQIYNLFTSGKFRRDHVPPFTKLSTRFNDELKEVFEKQELLQHQVSYDAQISENKETLSTIAKNLLKVLHILTEEIEPEKKPAFQRNTTLPAWLQQATNSPLRANWSPISEVISLEDKTGYLDIAIEKFKDIPIEQAENFPGVRLRTDEETVSIIALRNFLNEWSKRVIEEDQKNPFPNRRIFLPAELSRLVLFPSKTTSSVALEDLEIIQKLDIDALDSFKEILLKPLAEQDKNKGSATSVAEHSKGEDGGDDDEQKTQLPRTTKQQEKLKEDILQYQHHVQEEAIRLEVVSRKFVLALHNFPTNLPPDVVSSEAYKYLIKEINSQVVDLLTRDPNALDDAKRREIVIHSFLFKLMANPKFQTYLSLLKDKYATVIAAEHTDLTPEQQEEFKKQFLEDFDKKRNPNVDELITDIYTSLKVDQFPDLTPGQRAELTKQLKGRIGPNAINQIDEILRDSYAALLVAGVADLNQEQKNQLRKQLTVSLAKNPRANLDNIITSIAARLPDQKAPNPTFDPKNLSREHFVELLNFYEFTAEEQQQIFNGSDLLMYMRISPERILKFTLDQNEKIFGVSFSKLDAKKQRELAQLLSFYLVLRRQWFEKEYNADSVSQAQDAVSLNAPLTQAELQLLLAKKELFKNSGLDPRHFVRASMLTPSQLNSLVKEGKPEAAETKTAADALYKERKEIYTVAAMEITLAEKKEAQLIAAEAGEQLKNAVGLSEAERRNLLAMVAMLEASIDLSPFEIESGIVLNGENQIIRTADQAAANFRQGGTTMPGITPLKALTNEGAALLGGAAVNALLPGIGFLIPKSVKEKAGKVIVVGGVIATAGAISVVSQAAEFISHFGVIGMGGFGGTLGGALIGGTAGGPLGALLGGVSGGIAGAGGTAFISNGGLNGFGGSGGGSSGFGTYVGGAAPGSVGTAPQASFAAKAATSFKTIVTKTPAGVAVGGFVGATAFASMIVYSQYSAAFLPPERSFASDVQSKYVTMSKVATPTKADNPGKVSYSIKIDAKAGYQIEITNITDTMTVATKDKSTPTVPTSPDFSQYKTTLDSAGTSSVTIPYDVNFDGSFKDSLVTNNFQITFNAISKGASVSDVATAKAAVCFGNCPKPAAGCWPASGKDGQDPFDPRYDHALLGEDAFDIMAPVGTPIYAPFAGKVCAAFMPGHFGNPTVWGFGNYLILTDTTGRRFLFGHLSKFADGIEENNCTGGGTGTQVLPGDLVGFVGNTGSSATAHLHYQFDVYPPRQVPPSILRTLIPPEDKDITIGGIIRSCYDGNQNSSGGGASFN